MNAQVQEKNYKVARNKSFWRNSNKRVCKYKDAIAPTHLTQPTPTQKYDVSTAREYHVAYKGWISAIHNFLWRSITLFLQVQMRRCPTPPHPTNPTPTRTQGPWEAPPPKTCGALFWHGSFWFFFRFSSHSVIWVGLWQYIYKPNQP